jgi:hypothetical protein
MRPQNKTEKSNGRIKAGEGTLIGNAGEFYVAAELLKRGVIAALAPRNAHSLDIVAAKEQKTARIRVKTKSEAFDEWQWMTKKDGSLFRDVADGADFTVLVNLAMNTANMAYFVIPTKILEQWLIEDYQEWVRTPGRNGRPHDGTTKKRNLNGRKYASRLSSYLNNWDSIWDDRFHFTTKKQ